MNRALLFFIFFTLLYAAAGGLADVAVVGVASADPAAGQVVQTSPQQTGVQLPGVPQPGPQQLTTTRFMTNSLMFLVVGFLGYYLIVTRPAVQKEDQQKALIGNLKKNDQVMISPGIFGKVIQVQDKEIVVDIANGTKIRVLPSAIEPVSTIQESTK